MAGPQRIVSLWPSATDILCALGLEHCLVGLSHVCDTPPGMPELPRVTLPLPQALPAAPLLPDALASLSMYPLDLARLQALQPDLIVTQDQTAVSGVSGAALLEATRRSLGAPVDVVSLQPALLQDIWDDIYRVGVATGTKPQAMTLLETLFARVNTIVAESIRLPALPRVAILTDVDPLRLAGDWFADLVQLAGGVSLVQPAGAPSVVMPWETLQDSAPDVVVCSPWGASLQQAQAALLRLRALPRWEALPAVQQARVYAVEGQALLHRSGPRVVESLELLAGLMHPDLFGEFLASTAPFYCQITP